MLKNKTFLLFFSLYFVAVVGVSGCGKTAVNPVQTPEVTIVNQYSEIEYYNNKGFLLKDEYYGSNAYSVEYTYDETNNLLNAKITGTNTDRTIYKINCYYSNNLLVNRITYDNNGVIEENCNYSYSNGVLSKCDRTYYDADGKHVEISEYDSHGQVRKISCDDWYTEYEDNVAITYRLVDGEYQQTERITFEYEEGEIVREIHDDKCINYLYGDDGLLERELTYVPNDENEDNLKIGKVYEYDDKGNNIRTVTYRIFTSATEVEYVVEKRFDSHNNVVCQITNDKIDFLLEYVYYDNGIIKEIRHLIY